MFQSDCKIAMTPLRIGAIMELYMLDNTVPILVTIDVTFCLNVSELFQRSINATTNVPIKAITANTGALRPPRAVAIADIAPSFINN